MLLLVQSVELFSLSAISQKKILIYLYLPIDYDNPPVFPYDCKVQYRPQRVSHY